MINRHPINWDKILLIILFVVVNLLVILGVDLLVRESVNRRWEAKLKVETQRLEEDYRHTEENVTTPLP